MWKYFTANDTRKGIDVLDQLLQNYNHSYHRSIKIISVEASRNDNKSEVYKNLYRPKDTRKSKFKMADNVHIFIYKQPFRKRYLPTFTDEIFCREGSAGNGPCHL